MPKTKGNGGTGCAVTWMLAVLLWFAAWLSIIFAADYPWVAGAVYIVFTVVMILHFINFEEAYWSGDIWIKVYVASVAVSAFLGFVFAYQVFVSKTVIMFEMGWIPVVQAILMVGSLLALGNFGPPQRKKIKDS